MRHLRGLIEFTDYYAFKKGVYEVCCLTLDGQPRSLFRLHISNDDEPTSRHVPNIELQNLDFKRIAEVDIEMQRLFKEKERIERETENTKQLDPSTAEAKKEKAETIIRLKAEQAQVEKRVIDLTVEQEQLAALSSEQQRVLSCLVRAGVRHPGLRNEDLHDLHKDSRRERHIEVFTDLNSLTTGLAVHVVRSLGQYTSRAVVASPSIDVLHEYQAMYKKSSEARLAHAEMARALQALDDIRVHTPVHIHQLPPGATRYFSRRNANQGVSRGEVDLEERTYISEDRQMIAAYWNYVSTSNPRVPVRLITSDLALARVCVAERVPLLFARTPHEQRKQSIEDGQCFALQTLFFDPFCMRLRYATTHSIIWEICLIFRQTIVRKMGETAVSFSLSYEPGRAFPTEPVSLVFRSGDESVGVMAQEAAGGLLLQPHTRSLAQPSRPTSSPPSASTPLPATRTIGEVKLKLSITSLLSVLPTRSTQKIQFASFPVKDIDQRRQFRQIGEVTQLYSIEGESILAGPALAELLEALKKKDYVKVNAIFRRHPSYDRLLIDTEAGAPFPNNKQGGAATGWAVVLGAAYKTSSGVKYGLSVVPETSFEEAIIRAHSELSYPGHAAPLPDILDRVCVQHRMSPIRFESQLAELVGSGALRRYEVQRATMERSIPSHLVLVEPTSSSPKSYLRHLEPGKGVMIGGQLVSSLVKRPEVS